MQGTSRITIVKKKGPAIKKEKKDFTLMNISSTISPKDI